MPFRSRNCWLSTVVRQLWLVITVAGIAGCGSTSDHPMDETPARITIAVSSYPLLVMTERMGGDAVDVEWVIRGETTSPYWNPTSDAVHRMQQATRILISGGDYEPWLQRVTLPRSRLTDTTRGYSDQLVRIPDAVIHQHGPDGGHSHPGVVWATWLDPLLAASQMEQTRDVLLEILPDYESRIRGETDRLAEDFRRLDTRLETIAAAHVDNEITVLGDAPVYQYLTQRLGWELKYLHLPPRGPLSAEDRQILTKRMGEYQPAVVFVRSTLAVELDELRGDSNVPFVFIDLCDFEDEERTLVQRMNRNLDQIQRSMSP